MTLREGVRRLRAVPALSTAAGILGTAVLAAALWSWVARPPAWVGPVRVGFRASPPFYFVAPDGRPQGLAIDVIRTAAERAGLPLAWVRLDGPSVEALEDGRIDVWPTVPTVGQAQTFHRTEPWLEVAYFLVFPSQAGYRDPADVAGRTVAVRRETFESAVRNEALPAITPLMVPSPEEKLQAVCSGRAAAAFMEGREGQALLLKRPAGCEQTAFGFMRVPGAALPYAIGATLAAAGVADVLRDQVGAMSEDGTLAAIHAKWSFTTADEVRLIYALQQARWRGRVISAGAAVLAVGLLGAIWLAIRSRQAQRLSEAYALEQERYRRLFERNLAGVYRATVDGVTLDCNDAFARMLGCASRQDLLGRSAWDFYADRSARLDMIAELRRVGVVTNREQVFRRTDGRPATLLLSTSLVPGTAGEPDVLEGTAVDVSRERELEERFRQAQKLESVGRLAGGVAHDFNNTLTAINGYTELALTSLDSADPAYDMLLQVRKAGQHAESLTRQLLAFSRRQHLQPTVINLNTVVTDTRRLLQRIIGEDIELVTDLHPELANVQADQGQVQQVLMNLAVNARDAMPNGGRVRLSTSNVVLTADALPDPDIRPGIYSRLRISDTGHGMDAATQSQIFEPFFTTKERGKGTGLGLATVYGIVKQSGGHIRVRSVIGEGTTFDIDLPSVSADVADTVSEPTPAGLRGTETILVVEDQDDVRRIVREALDRRGYSVLDAPDGSAGIALCRTHPGRIDLLLTDVVMPGLPGPVVAERCCALRPSLKVLFMSGYADGMLQPGTGSAPTGAFLQKPFTPIQLAAKVRDVLDAR